MDDMKEKALIETGINLFLEKCLIIVLKAIFHPKPDCPNTKPAKRISVTQSDI